MYAHQWATDDAVMKTVKLSCWRKELHCVSSLLSHSTLLFFIPEIIPKAGGMHSKLCYVHMYKYKRAILVLNTFIMDSKCLNSSLDSSE